MKSIIAFCLLLFISPFSFAIEPATSSDFDMRSSGKIYVVIAVLLLIFIGIALYLFSLDKRLKKLEQHK